MIVFLKVGIQLINLALVTDMLYSEIDPDEESQMTLFTMMPREDHKPQRETFYGVEAEAIEKFFSGKANYPANYTICPLGNHIVVYHLQVPDEEATE